MNTETIEKPDIETIKAELSEVEAQAEALRAELDARRREQRAGVIEQIRATMAEYGIAPAELGKVRGSRRKAKAGASEIGGYRDIETGQFYTGKGKRPAWLNERLENTGMSIEQYREQCMTRVQ